MAHTIQPANLSVYSPIETDSLNTGRLEQTTSEMPIILNLVLFKIVWAMSLAGVVIGYAWLGAAGLVAFMTWHAKTVRTAKADFYLAGVAVLVGLFLDTLYLQSGLIIYQGQTPWSGMAPVWILALWANFALTMNGCMAWLQQRKWLAALLSFIFGPLGYYGGIKLGTATINDNQWLLFFIIGVAWAVAVPLLLTLAARFANRFHPKTD
ncbi:MAG: DUF2878 domain-containing protein [Gammaproteobacteria bacterium]